MSFGTSQLPVAPHVSGLSASGPAARLNIYRFQIGPTAKPFHAENKHKCIIYEKVSKLKVKTFICKEPVEIKINEYMKIYK